MLQLTRVSELRALPRPLVLIPTMGALHSGHAALIERGAALARERRMPGGCVVTIFVNPTQFNEPSDFSRYPRTPEADAELCSGAGAAAIFSPAVSDIYPEADPARVPPLPAVATEPGLEDAHRPGHFAGVCQVVLRLFEVVDPKAAIFGEKDWQQLQVISAMTREQMPGVEIIGAPTVRDGDGLALSSRNRFLSPAERRRALAIPRALSGAGRCKEPGEAERAMRDALARADISPDYAVVREAASLRPIAPGSQRLACRALIAARVGTVRLLDNGAWPG